MYNDKELIVSFLEAHKEVFNKCAADIHAVPELSLQEYKSAALLEDLLESYGFTVERGLEGLPTAFRATYGTGKLHIGTMCEYDALASLQQDPGVTHKQGDGTPGHGCGHNLLGVGSAATGIALKDLVDNHGLDATIIVYGTPAEEQYSGKTIMIRNGYFRDVDVMFCWHPLDRNLPGELSPKATRAFLLKFHGVAAHACNCPEKGISALDAAELTNIGVNYLREHVTRDCYMHYSYNNGGERPNIVPDYAELSYMVRSDDNDECVALQKKVERIARGACVMTGATVETEMISATMNSRILFTLSKLAYESMCEIGAPQFDDVDRAYAAEVAKNTGIAGVTGELDSSIEPADGTVKMDNGSTDVGDVSHIVPTLYINTACCGRFTPNHSWAMTTQTDRPAAFKGMQFAAATLALVAAKVARDPELYAKVKEEFAQN